MRWIRRRAGVRAAAVLLFSAFLSPREGAAQRAGSAADDAEGAACFHPRPLPACRSFWITELGVQWFVSPPPGVHDRRRWLGTWEVGWMKNRAAGDALGGSVFLAMSDNALRSGVRARWRRWAGDDVAVDVSPALVVFQADDDLEVRARPGAALQAGVAFRDWVGVSTQVEALSGGVRLQAGARLGSYPGAAAGLALPLLALIGADDS